MTNNIRRIGFGPIIHNVDDINDDTPDNAVVSIDVAAALTGHTVSSLRKYRQMQKGPKSFVHNHKVAYRLGDLIEYQEHIYNSTVIGDETA